MSSKLRSVNTKFWDDQYIQELSITEKLLFLYLLTNPLTNILGIYEITKRRICFDTGANMEMLSKAFKRFERDRKVIYIDGYVFLPNFMKNNRLNPNMCIGARREFDLLPNDLKNKLFGNDSKAFESLSNGMLKYEVEDEVEDEVEVKNEKHSMPDFSEFNKYAQQQALDVGIKLKHSKVKAKYLSWKENNWRTGKNAPIKNWKTTLLNTLQYLAEEGKEGVKIEKLETKFNK